MTVTDDQAANCDLLEKFLVANMVVKMAPCVATHKISVNNDRTWHDSTEQCETDELLKQKQISSVTNVFLIISPCPPINNIWAMKFVWR